MNKKVFVKSITNDIEMIRNVREMPTKIKLSGNTSAFHVLRKKGCMYDPENTMQTVKYGGGSIMMWGWGVTHHQRDHDWCEI